MVTHRVETAFTFDLDRTLIDRVYQHVLAWREALDSEGIELSVWRIHRTIGMSGGLFTNLLLRETGLEFDAEQLDVGADRITVVGDSVWDMLAATRARFLGIGLLSGGYGVFDDPGHLLEHLDEVGGRR